MSLFFREYGENKNQSLIIIHGLFGSSKNWITNAKELSDLAKIYSIDVRNHGESMHTETHLMEDLIEDLKNFIEENKIEKPILLGHSMGGLNAMYFSLKYPEIISKLIVLDIAPKNYEVNYEKEFLCLNMDVSKFDSRTDLDEKMEKIYDDKFIRQFLQMNLDKAEVGYKWKLNVKTLQKSKTALHYNLENLSSIQVPTLFILGSISEYIEENDLKKINFYFPNSKIETIQNAGHYLHFTHQKEFMKLVREFLVN